MIRLLPWSDTVSGETDLRIHAGRQLGVRTARVPWGAWCLGNSSKEGMFTVDIGACLSEMHKEYETNPEGAVRGQRFIKILHKHLSADFEARLTAQARRRGIRVALEATIFGSHKPKDVDISVVDPENGPLMMVGIRSQMSSIGKNALTYYEGIIGECISLQDRFPLSTIGYVYLMPLRPIKEGKEKEVVPHGRYAQMYAAIAGRTGQDFSSRRGIFDQFAYMVVDFEPDPPALRDSLVQAAAPKIDLTIGTFVDRMVSTFKERHVFLDDPALGIQVFG